MLDAMNLLRAMDGVHEEDLALVEELYCRQKAVRSLQTKRIVTFLLAAALVFAVGVTAYAVFSSFHTRVPENTESFRIHWEENPSGYLEWKNTKFVVTFPETLESQEIEFCPVWLPEEMSCLNENTWLSRMTAERLVFPGSQNYAPAYEHMSQPLLIESYSMSQFNQGGALLLLYFTPDEIREEHWDSQNVDVMYFHATEQLPARPESGAADYTLEQNFVLMSNSEAGWIVRLCGEIEMDQILKVAQNLAIRETGRTLCYDDFENHYAFFDGGVG